MTEELSHCHVCQAPMLLTPIREYCSGDGDKIEIWNGFDANGYYLDSVVRHCEANPAHDTAGSVLAAIRKARHGI